MQSQSQEFELSDADFKVISKKIFDVSGIVIADQKKTMVYSRLVRRLRALKLDSFSDYIKLIEMNTEEFTNFINSLTTNLTSFFRESHHFDFLKEHLKNITKQKKSVRIWSAGCSAGMEPYSIAMVVMDIFGNELNEYDIKILATDIDTDILSKAKTGIYDISEKKNIPEPYFKKYCNNTTLGDDQKIGINPAIRKLVFFNQLNLLSEWPIKRKIDIIFCRNVIIYFDKNTQINLFKRFHQVLENSGVLFIGHSETIPGSKEKFELIAKTTYKKLG